MKKRILVSLHLSKMSRSEKVSKGLAVHEAITNSPFFPLSVEKTALLLALLTATNNLQAADAETASGSHASYAAANAAELQFDTAFRNCAYYVQSKADADPVNAETIILSAELNVKRSSVKMKAPNPVDALIPKVTGLGNAIKLSIDANNPCSTHYEILMTTTPDDATSWISIADITARKFLVVDLDNGTRYFFKVRAINSIGKSVYSAEVSQIAA